MTAPFTESPGFHSALLYTGLVALVAVGRGVELVVSHRHVRDALARGGREYGAAHYPLMVGLHVAFLVSCLAEVWLLRRGFRPAVGVPALLLLLLAVSLRYWTMATLGARWTTRVLVVPGDHAVKRGPFRFLRHPNYLAVALEILALPMVHGAWLTAGVFTGANALLLRRRIEVEESALREHTDWSRVFTDASEDPGG